MPSLHSNEEDTLLKNTTTTTNLMVGLIGLLLSMSGVASLISWYSENIIPSQISAVFIPMTPDTAFSFLLTGLGFIFFIKKGDLKPSITGAFFGCIVILTGLLTLTQYIFTIDLGLDKLMMHHDMDVETLHLYHMAPNAAFCFLMTGAVLITLNTAIKTGKLFTVIGLLGVLISGLGVTALAGLELLIILSEKLI